MTSSVDQQHRLYLFKRGNLDLREGGGAEQLIFLASMALFFIMFEYICLEIRIIDAKHQTCFLNT